MKVPLFPFHTWLPDAHTDAPTAGSVVLAGVMLKMGTYGFLRFAVPFFPQAAVDLAPILLVARGDRHHLRRDRRRDATEPETDHRVLVGRAPRVRRARHRSRSRSRAISGGLFTMLSHGLTTGALFLLVGMLYDRRHTYEISEFRGLWKVVPVFGGLFVAATFASIGLPGFSGFVGEFLSLLGAFLTSRWYVVVAATGVILAAVYLLWAVQRAFTGEPDEANAATTRDRLPRARARSCRCSALSLFLGFYPKPVLDRLETVGARARDPRRAEQRLQGAAVSNGAGVRCELQGRLVGTRRSP